MHEASLVRSLLKQVEQLRAEHGGTSVKQIEVEIGPLSGVEPILVREAFEVLIHDTQFSATELLVNEVPLMACCETCHAEFELRSFHFLCPACGARTVRVTHGDEFRLLNVTLKTELALESIE